MDCTGVRALLNDYGAGRIDPARQAAVAAHLAGCEACRRALAVESALTAALGRQLPRYPASEALRDRLRHSLGRDVAVEAPITRAPSPTRPALAAPPSGRTPRSRGWAVPVASACAAAALAVVVTRMTDPGLTRATADLASEVVNDHLRVVTSAHPIDIESGGIHQVKPWFSGRVDFAPRVTFSGDADFPLLGGSVGYVHERKAAVFHFRRHLHAITLLVFPADGLPWSERDGRRLGRLSISERLSRGFSVLLWRDDGLGYALVSDVNRVDLETLATRINAPP
jgi:anti-sigma factor RsiW